MIPPKPPKPKAAKRIPERIRVTKIMRVMGVNRLVRLRREFWEQGDEISTGMLPLEVFLPTDIIRDILDNFTLFLSKDSISPLLTNGVVSDITACAMLLKPFTRTVPQLEPNTSRLLEVIWELHALFDEMRAEKKQKDKEKAQAKRAAAKEAKAREQADEVAPRRSPDVEMNAEHGEVDSGSDPEGSDSDSDSEDEGPSESDSNVAPVSRNTSGIKIRVNFRYVLSIRL